MMREDPKENSSMAVTCYEFKCTVGGGIRYFDEVVSTRGRRRRRKVVRSLEPTDTRAGQVKEEDDYQELEEHVRVKEEESFPSMFCIEEIFVHLLMFL